MLFNKRIYVDIATLFDLRQGGMTLIDFEFAAKVTAADSYYVRDEDMFATEEHGSLSKELLKEVIATRRVEVLKASLMTKMPSFIKQLYASLVGANAKQSVEMALSVDVNIYPFSLSESEKEVLKECVFESLDKLMPVYIIDKPATLLPAEQVGETYVGMIFYEYGEWVNSQEKTYNSKHMKNTVLYVPRLFFGGKPKAAILSELNSKHIDPFEMWERAYASLLRINYIPSAFFSVDLPSNKSEFTQPV